MVPLLLWRREKSDPLFGSLLIAVGAAGLAYFLLQGFGIGLRGFQWQWLTALFGELDIRQFGMGWGAVLVGGAFLFLLTLGLAARGAVGGDEFVVGSIGFVIAVVALFIFMPILQMFSSALVTQDGDYSLGVFLGKLFSDRLWGLGCLSGGPRCGVAWNSLFLAILVGIVTTAARPRLRADGHAHRLPLRRAAARADGAADHHAALRHRPRHHPALRPVGRRRRRASPRSSTCSRRAGSTACPAC